MRSIPVLVLSAILLVAPALADTAPVRILAPADGATVESGEPLLEFCVDGADDPAVRERVRVTLDGDRITSLFDWDGDCARWRYRPRPRAFEARSWALGRLEDGEHTLTVTLDGDEDESHERRVTFDVRFRRKATRLTVGASDVALEGLARPAASVNQLELGRGRSGFWSVRGEEGVVRHEAHGLRLGSISTSLWSGDPDRSTKVDTTLRYVGELDRTGYGYRVGSGSAILPYRSRSLFAGRASIDTVFDDLGDPGQAADAARLEPFDREWRLALATGAGVAFRLGPRVELDVGYERTQLYPHLVFWEAVGSTLIHGVAIDAADRLTERVLDRAPRAAPIVDFVLKNAISWAVYEQRAEEMNWPFSGPAPLDYRTVRLSFAFTLAREPDRDRRRGR